MSSKLRLRLHGFLFIITGLLFFQKSNAQCSTGNPAGCSCPGGGTTCLLLPDITAGKTSLNATTG